MKKFKFGSGDITFGDNFEFYNDYWIKIQNIAEKELDIFSKRINSIKSIETLVDSVDNIAQLRIDSVIEKVISMLLENGIIDYDIVRFKNRAGDVVDFSCQETTKLLKNSYQRLNKDTRERLLNDENLKKLKSDLWYCIMKGVRITFVKMIEEKTGKDAGLKEASRAEAIYNNVDRILDTEQKIQALKEAIELNPYEWSYIQYVLDNNESMGISLNDIQEIAQYVDKSSFLQYQLKKYREKVNNAIKQNSIEDSYSVLKELAIEYGFIDNQFGLIKQENNIGMQVPELAVMHLAWIKITVKYGNLKEILDIDSYFDLLEVEGHIVEILDEHRMILKRQNKYELKSEFRNVSSAYGKQIKELIYGLPIRIEKLYLAARTVRGIIFGSIDEAEIFKCEIEKYEKIYLQGKSYADYESACLEEVLQKLKSQNFKSNYLIGKISELEKELPDRKEHETVENLQRRQKLVDSFSDIVDENLYLYRNNKEFLEEAYKAKVTEEMKQNKDTYPIIIYNVHSKTEGISGFVLSERFLYDYTSFLENKILDFKDIRAIAYNEEKKLILISTIAGKTHKLKLSSSFKVREIAMALALAILNQEATYFEIPGVTKQVQSFLNNGKNMVATWMKDNMTKNAHQNKTKQCSRCGFSANLDAKFCKQCGAKFESYNVDNKCPKCGNFIKENMKFCPRCGEKLTKN